MAQSVEPTFTLELDAVLSESDLKSIRTGMQVSYDLGRKTAAADVANLKPNKSGTVKLVDAIKAAEGTKNE